MTQKLREILQSVLLNIKADGLCNLDESCGCGLDDLAPCGNCNLDECEPAKWIKPEDGNPMVLEEFPEGYYSPLKKQAARIQELESSLDEAEALTKKNAETMNAYLARIAELEDALVEERAKYNLSWKDCAYRAPDTYCEKTHNYCTSEDCPLLDEQKTEARRQLKEEGKIGPDAAKPRSWQITEERKAALAAMSNLSETISCPDCGVWIGFADIGPHMAVLRAMLREAE